MANGVRKKIGKYDVLDVLGRGGMGVVYKAIDPGIGRTVAIKMTTEALGEEPELLKRFYREAQSVGKLQHPNIVTVYDLGVEDGNPYLVMQFLDGESLESLAGSRRSIALDEKLDIVIQICNGVQYAHQNGVIHRDIKPANVMLMKDGTAKIVDFGIARMGTQKHTRPGQMMGSFQYMSPEQINTANVDARTDIFSIGVLLFQMVTGTLPFQGKDTGEMLMKIIHDAPPSLNGLLKNCPPGLDDIVQRALAKDVEQRYQTAEELALDLGHVVEKLRRERVSDCLQGAETAATQRQWNRAKEQLLQVLKMDRQNARASVRLKEVQQEIQKQQRGEQAKELQAQAEHALAQSDLSAALTYLNEAVELDRSNLEIVQLRDSVQENRARGNKLHDLMQRAEMAQDADDLEGARQAVEEGLTLDPQNTDFRSMLVAITRELAGRDKQKRVQDFLGEARKQISSRCFTAALEVLRKAEALDPSVSVVQELIVLASTGQQQERRRKELERLTTQIEEALDKDDYAAASARVEEGLRSYPEDRGLLKLKAVVDKQREGAEKRRYIEQQNGQARRLLDAGQSAEALVLLQSALQKYPSEPSLDAMVALVKQSIEKTRKDKEKAETLHGAREAIRRKAYSEAISILETARRKTASSEFGELLQFAQNEAANQAKRQKIDAVAEEARRLTSQDKHWEAIALLEATLQEIQDQELQIILADIRRHVAEFNAGAKEAVATAGRLMRQDRYAEAIKFLEGQDERYGKAPKFREALEEARLRQQAVQAVSALKEEVRDALSKGDIAQATRLCQEFRKSNDAPDIALVEKEIEAKQAESANAQLEMAVRDARLLVMVGSSSAALSVLESVATVALAAAPELRQKYEALQTAARTALSKQPHGAKTLAGLTVSGVLAPEDSAATQTQLADPDHLQSMLGEVTAIAGHYRHDSNVQSAIHVLKKEITDRIQVLREESGRFAKPKSVADGKIVGATATSVLPEREEKPGARHPGPAVSAVAPAKPSMEPPKTPVRKTDKQPIEQPPTLGPWVPPAKPSPNLILDDKREQAVTTCLAKARELQGAGDFAGAVARIKETLIAYPREVRLISMQETLEREIEAQRLQVRRNDLDELRRMESQAGTLTEKAALQALAERARAVSKKYSGDAEISSATDRVLARISKATPPRPEPVRPAPVADVPRVKAPAAQPPVVPPRKTEPPRPAWRSTGSAAPVREPAQAPPPVSRKEQPVLVTPSAGKSVRKSPVPDLTTVMAWVQGGRGKIALAGLAAVVLVVAWLSIGGKKQPVVFHAHIHTTPAGATIRINHEIRGVSDLQLDLPAGIYAVEAELNGYQPGHTSLETKTGSSNSVDLTLQPVPPPPPLLPSVNLVSDTGSGSVTLDDQQPMDMEGGRLTIDGLTAGDHKLKFESPQGDVALTFSTDAGTPPAVNGKITAKRVLAVVVGNLGSRVHVYCSETEAEVSLDGQPSAKISPDGLDLPNVTTGAHELLIKQGSDEYKLPIDVSPVPTLTAFLQSGKNIGSLLVTVTQEDGSKVDGVKVLLNGKLQKKFTKGGQLSIANLDPKEYTVAVSKDGFQDASQMADIRKGEQRALTFVLKPVQRFASLSIRGGTPGAQVFLDDKPVGTVQPDGTLTVPSISPGDHVVELRKTGYESKRLQKRLTANAETSIASAEAILQPLTGVLVITYSPPDAQVTLMKSGEASTGVASQGSLNLPPGTYTVQASSAGMTRRKTVEVVAGKSAAVFISVGINGMEKWEDPSSWKQEGNTYTHKGGEFVLYKITPTSGTFTFDVILRKGKQIEWFFNYASITSYVHYVMDENNFSRSIVRNGTTTDEVKIPHKSKIKKAYQVVRITVSPNEIRTDIMDGANAQNLDKLTSPGTNLAAGKFGFYIPGNDQIAIANFSHVPD